MFKALEHSSSSFDLPIIQRFGWVRQVILINQLYLCTYAYSGVLRTLSAPTLHNKTNRCPFNFMQEFWENYRMFSFRKIGKSTQTWDGFCFGFNHVLSRFYLRERISNPLVLHEVLGRINKWVLNKNIYTKQYLCLFFGVFSFITLIQNKIMRL